MNIKFINFIKEFVYMFIGMIIIRFLFYKVNLINDFSISSVFWFMVGWTIVKAIELMLKKD